MTENRCQADSRRRKEAHRDCGLTVDLGQGWSRRIEFEVGYDHREFPEDCGHGGHGQHGMTITFLLFGPLGATQWKINMPGWTPRPVDMLGNLPLQYPNLALIYGVDLGHHWRTPTYTGEEQMDCSYLGGKCYYDGSGLGTGPVLEKFLAHGPHAVWAELAVYYNLIAEGQRTCVE